MTAALIFLMVSLALFAWVLLRAASNADDIADSWAYRRYEGQEPERPVPPGCDCPACEKRRR